MDVLFPLSISYIIYSLCACGGEGRLCAQPVVMYMVTADDIIYEDLSQVGNLRTIAQIELGIITCYAGLMT